MMKALPSEPIVLLECLQCAYDVRVQVKLTTASQETEQDKTRQEIMR